MRYVNEAREQVDFSLNQQHNYHVYQVPSPYQQPPIYMSPSYNACYNNYNHVEEYSVNQIKQEADEPVIQNQPESADQLVKVIEPTLAEKSEINAKDVIGRLNIAKKD